MNSLQHAEAYAHFFEQLRPDTPNARYASYFEPDVYFEDPFHSLEGLEALQAMFARMFAHLDTPVFNVKEVTAHDDIAYLRWDFSYHTHHDGVRHFEGVSRVRFAPSGKAAEHIDYWDAARHVYEQLPVLGRLIAFVRRRIASA